MAQFVLFWVNDICYNLYHILYRNMSTKNVSMFSSVFTYSILLITQIAYPVLCVSM